MFYLEYAITILITDVLPGSRTYFRRFLWMMGGRSSSRMQESGKQLCWFVFQTIIEIPLSNGLCKVFLRINSLQDTWCPAFHKLWWILGWCAYWWQVRAQADWWHGCICPEEWGRVCVGVQELRWWCSKWHACSRWVCLHMKGAMHK